MYYIKNFTFTFHNRNYTVGTIVIILIPILLKKKQRHTEKFSDFLRVTGHTDGRWQSSDSTSGSLSAPGSLLLMTMLYRL